jgi:hypothetical protein
VKGTGPLVPSTAKNLSTRRDGWIRNSIHQLIQRAAIIFSDAIWGTVTEKVFPTSSS